MAVAPDGAVYSPSFGFNSDGALGGNGELFVRGTYSLRDLGRAEIPFARSFCACRVLWTPFARKRHLQSAKGLCPKIDQG